MAIDSNDMAYIRQVLDAIYVMQSDCDDKRDKINKELSNDDKRIDMQAHDLAIVKKLAWIIATSVIGILVTSICNLILR
jgi:hypothetical protein